jgi:hypothetical protein
MRGIRTFIVSVLLAATGGSALAADPDYFPLAVGNSWMYKVTEGRIPDVQMVEVTGTSTFEGRTYYNVNFFSRPVFLRSDGSTLYEYDSDAKREKVWIVFSSDPGTSFNTEIDNCDKSAKIDSKSASYTGPVGTFNNALKVTFTQSCADAGIQSETFLPYVGLVQHVVDNIAGARTYSLVYSRTGVTEVTTSEVRFSMALDAAVYTGTASGGTNVTARLTLRNSTPDPIVLQFPSGQSYDLKVRNEKGDIVYTWSANKLFPQIFRTESIGPGERNYVVQIPLPALPAGKYVVDSYLTTTPSNTYAASVGFEYKVTP